MKKIYTIYYYEPWRDLKKVKLKWNKFETREEAINFILNPDNSHYFTEYNEYFVMETFIKE